ncbi:hypothetical protein EB001_16175 [bacterium]|nr:hypothetical protein [bacterium]
MNEHSNPLDYILRCSEQGIVPKLFSVQNAKDELKRLREELHYYNNLQAVAWGKINSHGQLYDLRTTDNPYINDEIVVPLYSNRSEFKDFYSKFRKNNVNLS